MEANEKKLQDKLDKADQDNEKLKSELAEQKDKVKGLEVNLKASEKEKAALESKVVLITSNLEESNDTLKVIETKFQELTERFNNAQSSAAFAAKTIEEYSAKIAQLEDDLRAAKNGEAVALAVNQELTLQIENLTSGTSTLEASGAPTFEYDGKEYELLAPTVTWKQKKLTAAEAVTIPDLVAKLAGSPIVRLKQ